MADYKLQYNKFDIVRELLAQRYILTTMWVNINNLAYFMEGKEKAVRALLSEESRQKLRKSIKYKDTIEFDRFEISSRYYNALINKFGVESVTNGSILLDNYIKDNIDKQLSQSKINKLLKEYVTGYKSSIDVNEYLKTAISITKSVDYKMIDKEEIARQYIAGVPYYMRSIDKGCIYLKDKFNIDKV